MKHKVRFLFGIFFCAAVNLFAQAVGDYQTAGSGNWNALATWQTWNGSAWVAPGTAPNSTSGVITILATHTVTITANVTIDEVIVNGTLTSSGASPTTIANGAGVDLTINGTFADNYAAATNVITWTGGATWQMGASGTLIKTTASSSNNWQSTYQGGIATIPSTANWIIRRNTAVNIPMSSTTPASGSVYPNLTIENNVAGTWSTPAGSSFTGSTIFVTVKGNLDIGGAGNTFVDFLNNNTNANPTLVQGNVTIRTGCTMRNNGTGFEVRGNLVVNGTISYDANDGRRIVCGGGNAQSISGTGTLNVYDLTINKTANDVTLNRVVTVDNVCTFTQGRVFSSATNLLIIAATGSVTGASSSGFTHGPVRYLGSNAFTFPVGKNNSYRPCANSAITPSVPFWSENFNNGCTQGCLASAYSGPNGAWTVASTGTNDAAANLFFISCQENGNAVGACGTGCGNDATLHIANQSTSPAAFFFCPTGDCGAAYDAGLGSNQVRTSWRAESPTINCTGQSNIYLNFKYMEGGATTLDNALAWYFDGATWTLLADMAKTATTCGGGQGLWTAYSVALPASANNNPNVKVGFQWINNDDGAGGDPSFAVDNVTLGPRDFFTAEYFSADPQVTFNNVLVPALTSISNCEYWIIDRSPGSTASPSVTLTWDGLSCNVSVLSDLRVARWDGAVWQDEGNGGTTGTTTAGTIVTAAPVVSFSPFTLANYTLPLPIELLSFDAQYNGTAVDLTWTTATEIENDYFTIERAGNGEAFRELFRKPGAGNSYSVLHYTGRDPEPLSGTSYYRLRQTDFNGQYSFSNIVPVSITPPGDELQLQNAYIAGEQLNLQIGCACSGILTVTVYNTEGRLLASLAPESTGTGVTLQLPVTGWPQGLYLVKITDGKKQVTRLLHR